VASADETYCRVDVNFILTDPRWLNLSHEAKALYMTVWATAVFLRRERLPKMYGLGHFARLLGLSRHKAGTSLAELLPKKGGSGLLYRDRAGCITVCGVRSKHKRLPWNDETPMGRIAGGYPATRAKGRGRGRVRVREEGKEGTNNTRPRAREDSASLPREIDHESSPSPTAEEKRYLKRCNVLRSALRSSLANRYKNMKHLGKETAALKIVIALVERLLGKRGIDHMTCDMAVSACLVEVPRAWRGFNKMLEAKGAKQKAPPFYATNFARKAFLAFLEERLESLSIPERFR